MKKLKKLITGLTTAFTLCLLFANVISVQAYEYQYKQKDAVYIDSVRNVSGKWVDTTKQRITTFNINSIYVEFGQGDTIANLKSSNKALEVKETEYKASYSERSEYDASGNFVGYYYYGRSTISMFATKAGKYKITFDVKKSDGTVRKHCTVNVLATNSGGVYTKVTLGKKTLYSYKASVKNGQRSSSTVDYKKVTDKSGKLKVTANSQYQITGIVVASVDKKGKAVLKAVKNGKKITLSQGYNYENRDAFSNSSTKSARKETYIYISYKDKFTGDYVKYSVTKKRGKKEIQCTTKDGITGETETSYYSGEGGTFTLWDY